MQFQSTLANNIRFQPLLWYYKGKVDKSTIKSYDKMRQNVISLPSDDDNDDGDDGSKKDKSAKHT